MVQSRAPQVREVDRPARPRPSAAGVLAGLLLAGFAGSLAVAALALFVGGLPYWLTHPVERPDHALHPWFASGSRLGLILGLLGGGLMSITLIYSVRKWLPLPQWLGTNRFWMHFHVICGIFGPIFVILHGGVHLPTGFVGVGFWCMLAVAGSGVFGRYLFGWFPASAVGQQRELDAALERMSELKERLVAATPAERSAQVAQAIALVREVDLAPETVGGLVLLDADVRRRADWVSILLHRAELPRPLLREARRDLLAQLALRRSLGGFEVARRLLRFWSLFHQPLAVAMYAIAAIHVGEAVLFGGALATLLGWER